MNFAINEIFYSIQGEGTNTGRPAVFIRFSGCNLQCPFCDTKHDEFTSMSVEQIVSAIDNLTSSYDNKSDHGYVNLIVLTGGEPTLCRDLGRLCSELQKVYECEIALETNGFNRKLIDTLYTTALVDFITLSPKVEMLNDKDFVNWMLNGPDGKGEVTYDELKVVFDDRIDLSMFEPLLSNPYLYNACFIQPCSQDNMKAVKYLLTHPRWRLSVQVHKEIGIE